MSPWLGFTWTGLCCLDLCSRPLAVLAVPAFFERPRCTPDGRAGDCRLVPLPGDFVAVESGKLVAKANAPLAMWPVTICREPNIATHGGGGGASEIMLRSRPRSRGGAGQPEARCCTGETASMHPDEEGEITPMYDFSIHSTQVYFLHSRQTRCPGKPSRYVDYIHTYADRFERTPFYTYM